MADKEGKRKVQVRDPPKNPMKREAMDYVASLGLKWANVPTTLKSMDTPASACVWALNEWKRRRGAGGEEEEEEEHRTPTQAVQGESEPKEREPEGGEGEEPEPEVTPRQSKSPPKGPGKSPRKGPGKSPREVDTVRPDAPGPSKQGAPGGKRSRDSRDDQVKKGDGEYLPSEGEGGEESEDVSELEEENPRELARTLKEGDEVAATAEPNEEGRAHINAIYTELLAKTRQEKMGENWRPNKEQEATLLDMAETLWRKRKAERDEKAKEMQRKLDAAVEAAFQANLAEMRDLWCNPAWQPAPTEEASMRSKAREQVQQAMARAEEEEAEEDEGPPKKKQRRKSTASKDKRKSGGGRKSEAAEKPPKEPKHLSVYMEGKRFDNWDDLLYIESPFTYDVNASKASSAKHLGLDKYNQRAFFQSLRVVTADLGYPKHSIVEVLDRCQGPEQQAVLCGSWNFLLVGGMWRLFIREAARLRALGVPRADIEHHMGLAHGIQTLKKGLTWEEVERMAKDPTITAKITWQEIGEACSSDRLPSEMTVEIMERVMRDEATRRSKYPNHGRPSPKDRASGAAQEEQSAEEEEGGD